MINFIWTAILNPSCAPEIHTICVEKYQVEVLLDYANFWRARYFALARKPQKYHSHQLPVLQKSRGRLARLGARHSRLSTTPGATRGARRKTVGAGSLAGSAQTQGALQAWHRRPTASQAQRPSPRGTTWRPCGLHTPTAPLVIDVSVSVVSRTDREAVQDRLTVPRQ